MQKNNILFATSSEAVDQAGKPGEVGHRFDNGCQGRRRPPYTAARWSARRAEQAAARVGTLMKPVIGITATPSRDVLAHGTFPRYAMGAAYVEAVLAGGGVPVVLPLQLGNAGRLLDVVDGLLLSGGGDVEPWRYGADEVHETTYGLSTERDAFELELLEAALARDVPVLGICRGLQVLNVALGGTLIQDIASQHVAHVAVCHRQQEIGLVADEVGHPVVVIDPALDRIVASDSLGVNSFHHQAIARPAPDLVAAAEAPDGIVEAVVLPGRTFVVGVQWHPELMFERHPDQARPFAALVEAAGARRLTGAGR